MPKREQLEPTEKDSRKWRRMGLGLVLGLAAITLLANALFEVEHARQSQTSTEPALLEGPRALGEHAIKSSDGMVTFDAAIDRAHVATGATRQVRAELVIAADDDDAAMAEQRPTDYVVIVDRSSSMSGAPIEQARAAVSQLLGRLTVSDRFALIDYGSDATVTIPLQPATSERRAAWTNVVKDVRISGGTNISAALDLGLSVLSERTDALPVSKVILLSDGQANQGDTSQDGLVKRARHAASRSHVVSTVGLGENFNEFLMSNLADAGTGNYHYLPDLNALEGVLETELATAKATLASSLRVRVENKEHVALERSSGYPVHSAADATYLDLGTLIYGQERRVWLSFNVDDGPTGVVELPKLSLEYVQGDEPNALTLERALSVERIHDEQRALASIDQELWSRATVNDDYNLMRERVAQAVSRGDQLAALGAIDDYRRPNAALNRSVGSEQVQATLDDLSTLEDEVNDSFQGPHQATKRNRYSKSTQADAWKKRRAPSVALTDVQKKK